MNDDQKLVYLLAQIALFNNRSAGMIASNSYRISQGMSPHYEIGEFQSLEEEFTILRHNNFIDYVRG
jgi:hypothetical protein